MRTLSFVLFVAILAGLVLTNPKPDAFGLFAQNTIRDEIARRVPGIGGLGEYGARLVAPFVAERAERTNYGLASIYDLDLTGPNVLGGEYRFLGIAGQFIPLAPPAPEETR